MMRNETTGGIAELYEYYNVNSPAGTLAVTTGSATVTGTGTFFTTALVPGDTITISSTSYQVQSIASDTSLILTSPYNGATGTSLNWLPPTAEAGLTWTAAGGAQWNLTTGAPRREGFSSSNAAGLPISPLEVTYDQAATNTIDHPLLLAIPSGLSMNAFVWPAAATCFRVLILRASPWGHG